MIVLLFFYAILFILGLVRLLRWLAIFQQKEYRVDRLKAFLSTPEGIQELTRFIPTRNDVSRTGLKRPVVTKRVVFVAICGVLLISYYLLSNFQESQSLYSLLVDCFLSFIFIPLWLLLALIPSYILSVVLTYIELLKAQEKIIKYSPKIIGITGSYGKTSTKHLLTHILKARYSVFTTPASYNTKFSIAKAIHTHYKGEEIVVLEYGAYTKTEIKELTNWFQPSMVVITGLTSQHLELFGSVENIITAKADLIRALPTGAPVYYYGEDVGAKKIVHAGTEDSDVTVKEINKKDFHITDIEVEKTTAQLLFTYNNKKIMTNLVGHQYIPAISLAFGVARDLEINIDTCFKQLRNFIPNKNFISSYRLKTGALVIDDGGSANPKGVEAAFSLIEQTFDSKKIKRYLVFPGIVDLGDASAEIHTELAKKAKHIFTGVFYIGASGYSQFKQHIAVTEGKDVLTSFLNDTKETDVILLEGRMPGWLLETINKLRIKNEK